VKSETGGLLRPEDIQGVQNLALIARTIVEGTVVGLHRSHLHGFSMEFAEYREYSPGDDLRHFDWKAYGRSDRSFIKKFHSETNLGCLMLVDASASMGYGERCTKLRYASCLAAAMGHVLVRQQDSVGLAILGDGIRRHIAPASGTAHLRGLYQVLEAAKPQGGTSLARSLHDLAEALPRRGLAMLFSDLYDDEAQLVDAIGHFRFRGHEVIVFHLLHPLETDFDFDRLHDFIDLETGRKLEVHGPSFRDEYRARVAAWIETLRREIGASRAEYVQVDVRRPFSLVLADFLHQRLAPRGRP
jgi:uncharacterized protein (DUF58 family)